MNNDYELSNKPEFKAYKTLATKEEIDQMLKSMEQNSTIEVIKSCKYKLPCGRCDLTKEMCTNDAI